MKVVKINGSKEDIDIIKRSLETTPCNSIFILESEEPLYKFIETLDVDGNLLYNLNIAKEIYFNEVLVELSDKITDNPILNKIASLSNLLEFTDEDKIRNCRVVLDTEDSDLVSKVIQSLIYLSIGLEVMMKKEKQDRKIINAFIRKFDKIRTSVVNGEKAIQNLDTADDFVNQKKNNMLDILNEIEKDLELARERALNVSVMATKKAGKSVVVNSFLNEQYAPTSFELPTPNNCIYKRSQDNNIRLVYGKYDILFKSPQDIYSFIYKEFKKAQEDKTNGYTIDDMEIYYSSSDNSIASFSVIDTPGSNYTAATNLGNGENIHKKLAYSWIEKSDVILFLINYSNYLTIDEEEFFRNIKLQFEKRNKYYSLIVVVNKLDEMYISECENKSVVRFLDYIRCKLYDLGYKGFVVMGTSARSYFDLIKVSRIDNDILNSLGETMPIDQLKGSMLRERLKNLKKSYIGKSEMTSLSFIDDQFEKLECFYGIKEYDYKTLKDKSGIPRLKSYTSYVAVQKANVELYGLLTRDIDEKFGRILSSFIINNLISVKKEKKKQLQEIEIMINNIINKICLIQNDMEDKLGFNEFQDKLLADAQIKLDKILQRMLDLYEARVDEFFMKLMFKNAYELKQLKNKSIDIDLSINNKVFNEEFKNVIENAMVLLNEEFDKKIKYIKEAESSMKETVEAFSEVIRKNYDIEDFSITMPQINQDLKKMLISNMPAIDINENAIKEKILDSIELKENAVEKLLNIFMRNKIGGYLINSRQLRRVKSEYVQFIINSEYDAYYDLLKKNLFGSIDECKRQIDENFKRISGIYKNIFDDMLSELSAVRSDSENQLSQLENKLKYNNEINKIAKDFVDVWSEIRNIS